MNELQLFDNPEFGKVRVVTIDNEPYFVGKDVATALGYGNYRQALSSNVDAEDKGVHSVDTLGGKQNLTLINESGLYSLILSSKLPTAKKFKRWVTSEILPSIRKTGVYVNPQAIVNPNFLRRIADEIEARDKKISALENQVTAMEPKANYCDRILRSDEALAISIIAQDYGMSAKRMNQLLSKLKIQHRVGKTWVISYPYSNLGYVVTQTIEHGAGVTNTHTYWTQKGRFFLYNTLKDAGILPEMERDEFYLLPLNFEERVSG